MTNTIIMAGPCAIESKEQIMEISKLLRDLGVTCIRGGAYKPRTSPNDFQGLGVKGIEYLAEAGQKVGLPIVTEIVNPSDIQVMQEHADIIQIGSRNMANYDLLKEVGKSNKPVLLKRGFCATKKELLGAIAYIKNEGHSEELYVCERGIRTFANGEYDRFTLDLNLVADLSNDLDFPYKIIVDPSHPAGRSDLVANLAYAGIAAGADGLIIEASCDPYLSQARCDKKQHVTMKELETIIYKANKINELMGD